MQDTVTCPTPKPRAGMAGLDAYRVAVEFYRLLRQSTRGRRGHAIDQSYRAAESVVLNIAEAYPMTGLDRARRFRIAGGEAAECHAGLDLLEIRGELRGADLTDLRSLLDRARAMLWRLGRGWGESLPGASRWPTPASPRPREARLRGASVPVLVAKV